ncbi:phage major capsid protein, partial [Stutzerimonas nitrititolerans]
MSDFEKQYNELSTSLKQIGDQIKSQAEASQKEISRHGEMQAETRAKVDEMLTKQGELQARLQEAEQKLVNASKGGGEPERPKSAG